MAIALVGVVYVTLLQQLWQPQGAQLVADLMLHYFTPLATLVYWLMFVPHGMLPWQSIVGWMIYPLAYAMYAIVGGLFTEFYPYPFIDVAKLGYPQVFLNIVGLVVAFGVAGLLVVALDRVLGRRMPRGQPRAA